MKTYFSFNKCLKCGEIVAVDVPVPDKATLFDKLLSAKAVRLSNAYDSGNLDDVIDIIKEIGKAIDIHDNGEIEDIQALYKDNAA